MEIRRCTTAEELREATAPIVHYFGREKPDEAWLERWLKNFDVARMYAATDGDAVVGGAGSFPLRMTVPGGAVLPTAGVTVVGVLPTHRRRGILRTMMRTQLDDIHERGEPLAALWASEETIYGRYGYGLASLSLELEIQRANGAFRPGVEPIGAVRLVDAATAATLVPAVYDAVQATRPGMFAREASWWEHRQLADPPDFRFGGGPKNYAVLEADGEPLAYAIYRLHVEFGNLGPETKLGPVEVLGASPAATASIWRYLLDVDWIRTVSVRLLSVDHPLLLLLARPNLARPTISDGLWVRLVDVGAALSARSYTGEGRIVLDVDDAFCEWNDGRWAVGPGEAVRTNAEADLALDASDLASAYLGGFSFRELWWAGRVEELREGAVWRADDLFRTEAAPWCPEIF